MHSLQPWYGVKLSEGKPKLCGHTIFRRRDRPNVALRMCPCQKCAANTVLYTSHLSNKYMNDCYLCRSYHGILLMQNPVGTMQWSDCMNFRTNEILLQRKTYPSPWQSKKKKMQTSTLALSNPGISKT